jgi:hypothetical protein
MIIIMFETLTIGLAVGVVAFIVVALFNSQYRNVMQGLLVIGSVGLVIVFLYSLVEFSDSSSKTNNYSGNAQATNKLKTGCISGNCINGRGTFTWADGDQYSGEWKDDKKHGQGTYNYANGEQYSGEWKDGNRHGKGRYKYSSGMIYRGFWKDGIRDGKGTYTSADKASRWSAVYENGEDYCQGTFLEKLKYRCL